MTAPLKPPRTEKYCPRCNQTLPVSAFSRNNGRPDKLQGWCRTCKSDSKWGAEFPDYEFWEIGHATRRAASRLAKEFPMKYEQYVEEELRSLRRKGGRT